MSRRWIVAVAIGLLGILSVVSPLLSQATPSSREELGRRIEELRPELDEASRRAQIEMAAFNDSLRAANQRPQDTMQVGPFRIIALEGQGEMARKFFQPQVERVAPLLRGSESLFRDHSWAFFYGWRRTPVFSDDAFVHEVTLSRRHSLRSLEGEARTALGRGLYAVLPEDAGGLAQLASPATLLPPEDWSWVYRELASVPNLAAKECFDGNLPWCWEALGLNQGEGEGPNWDSPGERRRLVESRYGSYFWRRRDPWNPNDRLGPLENLLRGCLILQSDRACDLVLEGYYRQNPRPRRDYALPLSGNARGTLVGEALEIGGEGSFTRLIARPQDPLSNRLAYAAGVPAETLIARWRVRVLESKPNAQAGLLSSPLSLLFWLVLLTAFAIRSSRWRLG